MAGKTGYAKQDISTLQRIGHFYFALTVPKLFLSTPSEKFRFSPK
jgi:hypothetical protein